MAKGMEVVGRQKERDVLEKCFQSNSPEFIAIYGRSRVGKTHLVKKFFREKNCHFFSVTGIHKGSMKQQLAEFSKELSNIFFHGAKVKGESGWFDAFELLTQTIQKQVHKNKKVVLFFDEFRECKLNCVNGKFYSKSNPTLLPYKIAN